MSTFITTAVTGHSGSGLVTCLVAKAGDMIISASPVVGSSPAPGGGDFTSDFGPVCPADGVIVQLTADLSAFTVLVTLQRG